MTCTIINQKKHQWVQCRHLVYSIGEWSPMARDMQNCHRKIEISWHCTEKQKTNCFKHLKPSFFSASPGLFSLLNQWAVRKDNYMFQSTVQWDFALVTGSIYTFLRWKAVFQSCVCLLISVWWRQIADRNSSRKMALTFKAKLISSLMGFSLI